MFWGQPAGSELTVSSTGDTLGHAAQCLTQGRLWCLGVWDCQFPRTAPSLATEVRLRAAGIRTNLPWLRVCLGTTQSHRASLCLGPTEAQSTCMLGSGWSRPSSQNCGNNSCFLMQEADRWTISSQPQSSKLSFQQACRGAPFIPVVAGPAPAVHCEVHTGPLCICHCLAP